MNNYLLDCRAFVFYLKIGGPTIFLVLILLANTPSTSSVPCKIDHQDSKFCPFFFPFSLHRHPVFASPVAPSSPRPSPRLHLARRPVFASPVAPSSPRPSPVFASRLLRHHFTIVVSFLLGSGSAVLPNGLYAMGGTVAQAVWLKVDRRGNAPLGTPPLSMR
ncbi:hypothetical protein OUZ56_023083 [Daphnia magna]|uniref:Uncharacterized protein n=1 Tax=Daphnia magna TaxID=35525 RepID=A0ABR0AYA9_9CRUS|nr:hypothetical protein OUZ56_023083 [Daphnia magna]